MEELELLKLLLPEYLIDYYQVIRYEKNGEELHFYFEEKNDIPEEYLKHPLSSKGFYDEVIIQDFPIRGHGAYLHIKRRRWMNHSTKMVVGRNWDLIAKGTRMTADFATFLKEIRRF